MVDTFKIQRFQLLYFSDATELPVEEVPPLSDYTPVKEPTLPRSPVTTLSQPPSSPPLVEERTEKITGFKKAMVKTMSDALKIPHFGYSDEVLLNKLIR